MRNRLIAWLCVAALGFAARQTLACSLAAPTPHEVTTSAGSQPPAQVTEVTVSIERGTGPERSGCSKVSSTSCDDVGTVTLRFPLPDDDQTPSRDLGYRIALESGSSPLHLEDDAVLAYIEGDEAIIWLHWSDGDSDEQEPLRFTLTLRAVDSDGNLGPQSEPIVIQHAGKDEGCSLRGGRAGPAHLAALLALAGLLGLRRRK